MFDEFPIKNRWHAFLDPNDAWLIQCMSLDQLTCAICMCIFKVQWDTGYISDVSIDVGSGYCPSSKSIKLYRGVASGPNLSLTIDHMSLSCSLDFGVIQWSDVETALDKICCFCWLSVHVGCLSICRLWFLWGLTIGCPALPSHW